MGDEFDLVETLSAELGDKEDRIISLEKQVEKLEYDKAYTALRNIPHLIVEEFMYNSTGFNGDDRNIDRDTVYDNMGDGKLMNRILYMFDEEGGEALLKNVSKKEIHECIARCYEMCEANYSIWSEVDVLEGLLDDGGIMTQEELIEGFMKQSLDERRTDIEELWEEENVDCPHTLYNIRTDLMDAELSGVVDRWIGEGEWYLVCDF